MSPICRKKAVSDTVTMSPVSTGEKQRKVNSNGLEILANGVVSMRSLELNAEVPTTTRDPDAPTLFQASLRVGKAITFFSFVHFGKRMLVEKHRDEASRLVLFHSAAPYCLNEESAKVVLEADPEERSAYLLGAAKITQQFIRYSIYGQVINYFCEKVLTPRDVHPSEEVKKHLGLTGDNSRKSFMDL